ncbi:MAG: hypothetical protein L6R38_005828 [Xanthoria sp. 2 TBL-2021]|nr:MAG: hypothetical protein L6R38_005828 [Xanthoria sp. 2 TBL-2021]
MKSFVVSAIAGAAIIGMHGVTAILGAEAAAIPTMDAGSLVKRQDVIVDGGCWETSTGEVRCSAGKDKRNDLEKRQDIIVDGGCWETSTGEVRCSAGKDKRDGSTATGE